MSNQYLATSELWSYETCVELIKDNYSSLMHNSFVTIGISSICTDHVSFNEKYRAFGTDECPLQCHCKSCYQAIYWLTSVQLA